MPEVKSMSPTPPNSGRNAAIPQRLAGPRPACLGLIAGRVHRPPAYGLGQLRDDLERFVFLLGGSDGEPLFGPASH